MDSEACPARTVSSTACGPSYCGAEDAFSWRGCARITKCSLGGRRGRVPGPEEDLRHILALAIPKENRSVEPALSRRAGTQVREVTHPQAACHLEQSHAG